MPDTQFKTMDTLRENSIPERGELKKHNIKDKWDNVFIMDDRDYEELLRHSRGGRPCEGCDD